MFNFPKIETGNSACLQRHNDDLSYSFFLRPRVAGTFSALALLRSRGRAEWASSTRAGPAFMLQHRQAAHSRGRGEIVGPGAFASALSQHRGLQRRGLGKGRVRAPERKSLTEAAGIVRQRRSKTPAADKPSAKMGRGLGDERRGTVRQVRRAVYVEG
jgi:hypothetical protein